MDEFIGLLQKSLANLRKRWNTIPQEQRLGSYVNEERLNEVQQEISNLSNVTLPNISDLGHLNDLAIDELVHTTISQANVIFNLIKLRIEIEQAIDDNFLPKYELNAFIYIVKYIKQINTSTRSNIVTFISKKIIQLKKFIKDKKTSMYYDVLPKDKMLFINILNNLMSKFINYLHKLVTVVDDDDDDDSEFDGYDVDDGYDDEDESDAESDEDNNDEYDDESEEDDDDEDNNDEYDDDNDDDDDDNDEEDNYGYNENPAPPAGGKRNRNKKSKSKRRRVTKKSAKRGKTKAKRYGKRKSIKKRKRGKKSKKHRK
jgi:hypothetical protein